MSPRDESVQVSWNKAAAFHDYVVENFPKGTYKATARNIFFHSYCDLLIEHQGAVLHLVQSNQHDGSALALLRPLLECCIRALWVLHCGKEQRLRLVAARKKCFPDFECCQLAVDEHYKKHNVTALEIAPRYMQDLHGLVHGGLEQLQYRIDRDLKIAPNYPPELISKLLQQGSMWLAMASIERIQAVEGTKLIISPNTDRMTRFYISLFGGPDAS